MAESSQEENMRFVCLEERNVGFLLVAQPHTNRGSIGVTENAL